MIRGVAGETEASLLQSLIEPRERANGQSWLGLGPDSKGKDTI